MADDKPFEDPGYLQMSLAEKNQYLEGKLAILQKNLHQHRAVQQAQHHAAGAEKSALLARIERLKEEAAALKQEIREKNALLVGAKRAKRQTEHQAPSLPATLSALSTPPATAPALAPPRPPLLPAAEAGRPKELPIEWILSHLKSGMDFELQRLGADKLKIFGRFFKPHFDSVYDKETVLREVECRTGETKQMVKTVLYLSDRPEIVSQLLPYVFKKHIVPDGHLHINTMVKILYRTGLGMFLSNTDTVRDIKRFFEECHASTELLHLVEELAEKSPTAVGRVVSKQYLDSISRIYPEPALRIVERLENSGVYVSTQTAREIAHQADPRRHFLYAQKEQGLYFFF